MKNNYKKKRLIVYLKKKIKKMVLKKLNKNHL